MAKSKQVRLFLPAELTTGRERAIYMAKMCRERDAAMHLVPVRIDRNTTKLMPKEKAEKFLKQKENEN